MRLFTLEYSLRNDVHYLIISLPHTLRLSQQKRPSATGFDAFGSAPQSQGFDAFGPSNGAGSGGFDAFSGPPQSHAAGGFDAFSSPQAQRYPPQHQQQGQGQSQQGQHFGNFSNFGSPPPQQATAPMPFIRLAPPAPAPEPAPAPVAAEAPKVAPVKNFSAFDDLLAPATSAPLPSLTAPAPAANPFDAPHHNAHGPAGAPAAYPGYPPQQVLFCAC